MMEFNSSFYFSIDLCGDHVRKDSPFSLRSSRCGAGRIQRIGHTGDGAPAFHRFQHHRSPGRHDDLNRRRKEIRLL